MEMTGTQDRHRAYRDAIVRHVCSVCLDQGPEESCGLSHGRLCAIQAHLPAVVDAIASIQSDRMDEYVAAVEARICAGCRDSDSTGQCGLRDRGECALYTYLPLVVDAIFEVRAGR